MKIGRLLIFFVVLMALLITFGNRGVVDNYLMSKKLDRLKSQTREISVENEQLKRKILLLRSDMNYIEMVARNDLGMVKKGDIVYRWTK